VVAGVAARATRVSPSGSSRRNSAGYINEFGCINGARMRSDPEVAA
jgi:hypothetical protein